MTSAHVIIITSSSSSSSGLQVQVATPSVRCLATDGGHTTLRNKWRLSFVLFTTHASFLAESGHPILMYATTGRPKEVRHCDLWKINNRIIACQWDVHALSPVCDTAVTHGLGCQGNAEDCDHSRLAATCLLVRDNSCGAQRTDCSSAH